MNQILELSSFCLNQKFLYFEITRDSGAEIIMQLSDIDWNMISAIGTCASAIIMAIAACIAYYAIIYDRGSKLEAAISREDDELQISFRNRSKDTAYIDKLFIVNSGLDIPLKLEKKIIIPTQGEYTYKIDNETAKQLFFTMANNYDNRYQCQLFVVFFKGLTSLLKRAAYGVYNYFRLKLHKDKVEYGHLKIKQNNDPLIAGFKIKTFVSGREMIMNRWVENVIFLGPFLRSERHAGIKMIKRRDGESLCKVAVFGFMIAALFGMAYQPIFILFALLVRPLTDLALTGPYQSGVMTRGSIIRMTILDVSFPEF